jgi:hypothetical protein
MKQQDAYKLLAAFMILIMIVVPVAYVITSPRSDTIQEQPEYQQEKYDPELWIINQPFYSISDALNMTPPGAAMAYYVDLESMTPQMMQWARQDLQIIEEVDSLYKSNTTKMYYTKLHEGENESFLLLSTMYPEKNDFEYMVLPDTDNILRRLDTGAINIMGSPVIYAPRDETASDVLNIIYSLNRTQTSYDRYEGLLSRVEPAPFQTITSNVSFADQYYMGVGETNGSYERTTAYLNANSSTVEKLERLKNTQQGFTQYNITKSGNYTIVRITGSDLFGVLAEETG